MSSAPEETRFNELLSRYLDASLGDADEHELLQSLSDAALASRFYEATQLSTEIAGVLAGSIPNEVMVNLVLSDLASAKPFSPGEQALVGTARTLVPANVRTKQHRTRPSLALAATVLLLAVSGYYFFHTPRKPAPVNAPVVAAAATLSTVRGEVYLLGATGRTPLRGGHSLNHDATIATVGRDSRATVVLRDKTEIELKGDTTFAAEFQPGKRRFYLQQGMLVATVATQPADAPMIFTTSRATATVRGTQLAMVEEKSGTYLIVGEGRVALRRSAGGPEILIEAGFYGHVELEGVFHPFPIDRLPRSLRDQLSEN